jgi:Mlc titration factor MtfA (ptsG expression regulator)
MRLFRNARRRRLLDERLLEDEAWSWLVDQHPILAGLEAAELGRLRELTTLFLHEKTFEAARGVALTPDMKAVVSLQAALPVLELGLDWYSAWKTVVIVPDMFVQEEHSTDPTGVVTEWREDRSGESWDRGPVVLSWEDVEASGWGEGYNVVIHEAAHRLDLLDGAVNGRPALHEGMSPDRWQKAFTEAYRNLEERVRRRRRTAVDPYALEDPGEFFAVTSELFFERPGALERQYPDVYGLLSDFYRQDPARRLPA